MFSSFCISDDLSRKFVDYDAHCTYTVSFHRSKWIDMKLQLLEVLAEFHTVVLPTPNLPYFSVLAYKETKS